MCSMLCNTFGRSFRVEADLIDHGCDIIEVGFEGLALAGAHCRVQRGVIEQKPWARLVQLGLPSRRFCDLPVDLHHRTPLRPQSQLR